MLKSSVVVQTARFIHLGQALGTKIVKKTVQPKLITIEGIPQEFKGVSLQAVSDHPHQHTCPLCQLNAKVKYTDVLILRQFVDVNGKLLNKEVTGVCEKQQGHLASIVEQARTAGLIGPAKSEQVFVAPHRWKKFNVYYESPKRYTLLPNNNKI